MSSFTPITAFTGAEIGDVDKLNEIIANQNILYSLTPTFMYKRGNQFLNFDEGQAAVFKPVIYAGRISKQGTGARVISGRISFPAGTFAAACGPVINVTPAQNRNDKKLFATITHYSNDYNYNIGPEGFRYRVYEEGNAQLTKGIGLHFVAYGYQEA